MGTTLTGTTPANTYDSLIKVTDNGPLSGTAKYLSDGLGNDSALAVSTSLVGIGTNSGINRLSVSGSGSTALSKISVTNTNTSVTLGLAVSNSIAQAFIGTDTNHPLGIVTNDLERITITSAGNVGIGTASPNYSLQVNSSTTTTRLQITNSTTGTGAANGLQFIQDGNNTTISLKPSGFMSFETTNAERMRITSTGNVGIGTSSPADKLEVSAAGYGFRHYADATNYLRTYAGSGYQIFDNGTNQFGYYLGKFYAQTGGTDRLTIDTSGNVGIGTSSPAVKLDVAGRVAAAGSDYHSFAVASGSAQIRLERTGTNVGVNYIGSDGRGLVILDNAFGTRAIFTANGLTFNGDTAAANALDDYEEGTWTPVITASTTAPTGFVANYIGGSYTKIGRMVVARMGVNVNNVGTGGAGTLQVHGLPFTSANVGAYQEPTAPANGGRWATVLNAGNVYAFVKNGTAYTEFRTMASNADTGLTYSELQGGSETVGTWFTLVVTYFVS